MTIKASDLGKTKMVSQVVAVSLALLGIRHPEMRPWAAFCMWVVVFFGLLSADMYFVKFWRQIENNVKLARRVSYCYWSGGVNAKNSSSAAPGRPKPARLVSRAFPINNGPC